MKPLLILLALCVTVQAQTNLPPGRAAFPSGLILTNDLTDWVGGNQYAKRVVTTNWLATPTNSAVQIGVTVTNLSVEIIFRGATNLVQLAQDYGQIVGLRTNINLPRLTTWGLQRKPDEWWTNIVMTNRFYFNPTNFNQP